MGEKTKNDEIKKDKRESDEIGNKKRSKTVPETTGLFRMRRRRKKDPTHLKDYSKTQ